MRIVHVTNSLTRLGGGVAPVVWGIAMRQQALGHEISLMGLSDLFDGCDWPVNRPNGISIRTFPRNGFNCMHWSRQLHAALSRPDTESDGDLLHQHGVWSFVSRSVLHWRNRCKRPTVITPHGMLDAPRLRKSWWKKQLFAAIYENRNLQSASCVHALCPCEAESIRSYGIRGPICTIPNGIEAEAYCNLPEPERFYDRFPSCKGRRIVLFLGRITALKGLSPLLGAWKQLNRHRKDGWLLVIAGPSEGKFEESLESKARDTHIAEDVLFTGPLYGEAKREVLAAASVFVLPSFSEGFSMALLEAMACGLPLVITRQCNFNEIEAEGAGLITKPTARALTDSLDECLRMSDNQRRAMGRAGRNLVMAKYTWERVAKEFLVVYNWLLGGGEAPDAVLENDRGRTSTDLARTAPRRDKAA